MTAAGVEDHVHSEGPNASPPLPGRVPYCRELVFSRLIPALFFSVFLARYLLTVWDSLHSIHKPSDYLFLIQQVLALAYFTMLVILYSTRLPARGTDHRLAVVFIAFTGTFSPPPAWRTQFGVWLISGGPSRSSRRLVAWSSAGRMRSAGIPSTWARSSQPSGSTWQPPAG